MRSVSDFSGFFVHRDPVDMRKSIDGLSVIAQQEMGAELKSSSLFIFCNRRRTQMKILYFDKSGFALWFKRLEASKFPWAKSIETETVSVTVEDLKLLLDGINIWTRFKEVSFEKVI